VKNAKQGRKDENMEGTPLFIRRARMVARFRRGKKIADRHIGLEARLRMPCNGSVLPRWGAASCAPTRVSDAAGDIGEVEPDFHAGEVGAC